MRTDIINANTAHRITEVRVEVHNGTAWIDISGRRQALRYSYSDGRWSADITFTNHLSLRNAGLSLNPGHVSTFNVGGRPLLGGYNAIRILIGKEAAAALIFEGFIGPDTVRGSEIVDEADVVTVRCVGIVQPYFDSWIAEAETRVYQNTHISVAVNVLNQILIDFGFAPAIVIRNDPLFHVHYLEVGGLSVGAAIQRPVQSIGFILSERFSAGQFRPTIIDPLRANTIPDLNLSANIKLVRTAYTEANVRTWIKWHYRDRVTGKLASVIARDEVARTIYGIPDGRGGRLHRRMEIVEKEASVIDTRAEAMKAASMALHDLCVPCPEVEVALPWTALGIEGGDLVRVITPSETLDIGVTQINHTIGLMSGTTTFSGTIGRRVGAQKYWYDRGRTDWPGIHDRDRDKRHGQIPEPPTEIDSQGLWGDNRDGTSVPILHITWHGKQDPRIAGYQVRYKELELIDSGNATGGTATTLVNTGKIWTPHRFRGFYVRRLIGRATEQIREIVHNTVTEIIFTPPFSAAVAAGTQYQIFRPVGHWTTIDADKFHHIQIAGLRTGTYYISQVAVIPVGGE